MCLYWSVAIGSHFGSSQLSSSHRDNCSVVARRLPSMMAEEKTKESKLGAVNMKVTTKKPPTFCVRSAKSFLTGVEIEGGEKKEPANELNIARLVEAIKAAVAAASGLVKDGLGTVTKVETSCPGTTSNGAERGCLRILTESS